VTIVSSGFFGVLVKRLELGFHGVALLSPDDCIDGGKVDVKSTFALHVFFTFFLEYELFRGGLRAGGLGWYGDGRKFGSGVKQTGNVFGESEGRLYITLKGLNGLGELIEVGLLVIAFENVSVHLVGGALKAGRLVAFVMSLSSLLLWLSTLAVSATTVCPARSATYGQGTQTYAW
jgi:hypothetical protein